MNTMNTVGLGYNERVNQSIAEEFNVAVFSDWPMCMDIAHQMRADNVSNGGSRRIKVVVTDHIDESI